MNNFVSVIDKTLISIIRSYVIFESLPNSGLHVDSVTHTCLRKCAVKYILSKNLSAMNFILVVY